MKNRLITALALLLTGAPAAFAGGTLRVVTTLPDLADIAKNVGGELVSTESIAKGTQDPHFVDPKPSLLLRLSRADVFIQIGLELEIGWAPPLLDSARNGSILPGGPGFLDASAGVTILEKPTGAVSRAQGDVHPNGNPHYWLDPANGARIADEMAEAFSKLKPEASETFHKNAAAWKEKLAAKTADWKRRMAPFKGSGIVVYHRSWTYLAEVFGLNVEAEIEPKPGIPPSPGHTKEVMDTIRTKNVRVIVQEPYYAPSEGQAIAERTGAKFVVLPSMVGGAPGAATYLDLFEAIVTRLEGAFGNQR